MFSYYNLCLSPDHLCLLCTYKLHMNFNFFEIFLRITSLLLRILFICITYLLPYTSFTFQMENFTVFMDERTAVTDLVGQYDFSVSEHARFIVTDSAKTP